jgi:hypothetical protein
MVRVEFSSLLIVPGHISVKPLLHISVGFEVEGVGRYFHIRLNSVPLRETADFGFESHQC